MRRQSFLAAASLTVVAVAGTAVLSEAFAQAVPVTFGTDPGEAHPRYAAAAEYRDRSAAAPEATRYQVEATLEKVVVEAGDTVYGIARRHGLTPAQLIDANDLEAPYTLALGQTLVLPGVPGEAVIAEAAPATPVKAVPAPEAQEERAEPAEPKAVLASATAPAPKAVKAENGLTQNIKKLDERDALDSLYTVRRGDTLFALSRRFDVPVERLAEANAIAAPYGLALGQKIVIPAADAVAESQEIMLAEATTEPSAPGSAAPAAVAPEAEAGDAPVAERPAYRASTGLASKDSRFTWPLEGPIVGSYGASIEGERNDGIDIAAPVGAPIRAAADGEVVYKGNELAGYGNLVLVKHVDGWVSAYAHADTILVEKGDKVRQGQIIAKVGETGDVTGPQLHFELRHDLRPQDPVAALEGRLDTALVSVSY